MRQEVLRMTRVTYQEQGSTLLKNFNLSILAGEIMGVVPLNDGHGLTALIELLRRNLPLQAGNIYYCEELLNSWQPVSLRYNRISVIQSNSCLVSGMTVADNIFVLRPGFRTWLIRPKILRRQLQPLLDSLNVGISADDYVEHLTNFQRLVVELVKAQVAGSRLIILRDVSTFISDMELSRLHDILRYYAGEGISIMYLGFHYEELTKICDRTAFFSNGRIIKILGHEALNIERVEYYNDIVRQRMQHQCAQRGTPVLQVKGLSGGAVETLSFDVVAGECVVLQDLQNQMIWNLVELFTGERPIKSGEIWLDGAPYHPGRSRRIAVITERPDISMIFPKLSYLDNLAMTVDHRVPEIWRSSRVQDSLKQEYMEQSGQEIFDLPPERLTKRQKYDLVYQRILLQKPRVVFCIQPFKGADLEMRIHIWELLENILAKGIALVILAVNLADSLALASRLIRIRRGAPPEIYEQPDFARIPFDAPWLDLYRDSNIIFSTRGPDKEE